MAQKSRPFNWYLYDDEHEEFQINPVVVKKTYFELIFAWFSNICWYILCITFVFDLYSRYILQHYAYYNELNITQISNIVMLITWGFRCLLYLAYGISFVLYYMKFASASLIFQRIERYLIIFLWMVYCFSLLQIKLTSTSDNVMLLFALIKLTAVSTATFIFLSISMYSFENNFIEKTLKNKLARVSRSEKILRGFKKYTHAAVDDSSVTSNGFNITDIFCLDLDAYTNEQSDIDENESVVFRDIKDPVVCSMKDLLLLYNDIIVQLNIEDFLTLDLFIEIFKDKKFANEIFCEFDINHNNAVDKEHFKDILVYLYNNRVQLTKSLCSISGFIEIIREILYIISLLFISVIFLIMYGIEIKQMLALLASSAIIMNVFGKDIVLIMWKNIMFLISHQFDIGDEVIVDNSEMIVQSIGLSSCGFIIANGGAYKIANSDLWNKQIVNMTKAPEKLLIFTLTLSHKITQEQLNNMKESIGDFVKSRAFELQETFEVSSINSKYTDIKQLETSIILKFKHHTNKSKKYTLRTEFTAYLHDILQKHLIKAV